MSVWLWIGFIVVILFLLALDLGLLNRKAHVVKASEAMKWAGFCCLLALMFNVLVYFIYEHHWLGIHSQDPLLKTGWDAAKVFFTGWIVEQSLSLDNIFVIAVILSYFRVPPKYQHRVLFWGILGALVMRGAMIGIGSVLIREFSWITYVFAAMLLYAAIKMLRAGDEAPDPDRNPFVRVARRLYPVTSDFHEEHFFVHIDGRKAITPLFLALLMVESTDVIFAVDSIPAIFAVTKDPFIVFTSNVFAILNLRSLYFALADLISRFRYLKTSLVFILAYIAVKMVLTHHYHIPTEVSLLIILASLAIGIIASLLRKSPPAEASPEAIAEEARDAAQDR